MSPLPVKSPNAVPVFQTYVIRKNPSVQGYGLGQREIADNEPFRELIETQGQSKHQPGERVDEDRPPLSRRACRRRFHGG